MPKTEDEIREREKKKAGTIFLVFVLAATIPALINTYQYQCDSCTEYELFEIRFVGFFGLIYMYLAGIFIVGLLFFPIWQGFFKLIKNAIKDYHEAKRDVDN